MSLSLETRTNLLSQSLKEYLNLDLPEASGFLFYNGRLKEKNVCNNDVLSEKQQDFHYLQINSNKYSEFPLFLIHVLDGTAASDSVPKTRFTVAAGKAVKLVECFFHLDSSHSKHYSQSEIVLKEKSKAQHVLCFQGQNTSIQTLENTVSLSALSHYFSGLFSFNLLELNANLTHSLMGEKSKAEFQSLILAKKQQKINLSLIMHHLSSACQSNTLVRGVVDEKAQGSFSGKIIIEKEAGASEASLENKNILLSDHAKMNTRPLLEIYNNDIIKCSHGATIGNLDPEALFYLKSRGFSDTLAKKILIEGFIKPTLLGLPECILPMLEACIYEH